MTKILHPKAVCNIKTGSYSVPKEILDQTLMFVAFYFVILGVSGSISLYKVIPLPSNSLAACRK